MLRTCICGLGSVCVGGGIFEPVLLFNRFEFVLAWTGKNLIRDQHFCSDVSSKRHFWISESMHF